MENELLVHKNQLSKSCEYFWALWTFGLTLWKMMEELEALEADADSLEVVCFSCFDVKRMNISQK